MIDNMRREMLDSSKKFENREKDLLDQILLLQKKMKALEKENKELGEQNLSKFFFFLYVYSS